MIRNRKFVFDELYRLVCDFDDVVPENGGESEWSVDDALAAILIRLNGETSRARKMKNTTAMPAV